VQGPANILRLSAVPAPMIARLAGTARARAWNIAYATRDCVVATRQGARPDQLYTSVFLGGDKPVWDLNDKAIERCALAGLLQAFGIAPAGIMARADILYPHAVAPNPCLLAISTAAVPVPRGEWSDGLRCKSRARAAWPFAVLRRAAATGALKPGPIDRAAFTAALARAAQELGPNQADILKKEDALLRLADQRDIPNPVTR
jgi:hypothetical protein